MPHRRADGGWSREQLPFEVALPAEFEEQLVLLGARYCTINGELAAHVKFLDKLTDKQVSLFMARSMDGLHKTGEARERINGVNVNTDRSIWVGSL